MRWRRPVAVAVLLALLAVTAAAQTSIYILGRGGVFTSPVYVQGLLNLRAADLLGWTAGTDPTATADTTLGRSAAGKITLLGTTPTLQFGGTTSSQPALVANGARLGVKLADASAYTALDVGTITSNAGGFALNASGDAFFVAGGTTKLFMVTAPSAPASCGTSPAVTSSNGSAVFVITGGTGGAATGCTVTMPAATTGWNCSVTNITQTAAHRADRATVQTASTTTSVTWEYQIVSTGAATAFTASDVFRGICFAY
jgi:hypothetical protein